MSTLFIDQAGKSPYVSDDTRQWIESVGRKNGLIKPQLVLRVATDTNYVHNDSSPAQPLYTQDGSTTSSKIKAQTKCMMNVASPGMRIPGIQSWSVEESLEGVVQTASFECLNALPVSKTSAITSAYVPAILYDTTKITASWAADSLGVTRQVTGTGAQAFSASGAVINNAPGNNNVEKYYDADGYPYREGNVKYRTFANQIIPVTPFAQSSMPDPRIPNDDDNDVSADPTWANSATGQGAYFILIDDGVNTPEVMRVIDTTRSGSNITGFVVPPGGRMVNGSLSQHNSGAKVSLLGFAPYSGDWCAMGYLNVDDFKPQTSTLRPGTCLVSYEGYGDIVGALTHDYDRGKNYCFTGYWFVKAITPTIAEDGVPRLKVDLRNAGYMFDKQKITPDLLRRIKNQFGQWKIGEEYGASKGETIWGAAGHTRDVPGDWVDYSSWDPSLQRSYPLSIKTELGQHKAFFDHMLDTEYGAKCEYCVQEHADWLKTHKAGGANAWNENRAVGKHIYKESIRVLHPIKTFIRLMATLAAASWDHPALGTELAQKFTKIPNKLYDNIRNINTGLIYNGQISVDVKSNSKDFDWFHPTYDDEKVISQREQLVCPFDSSYDKAPFWQPMQDLADLNGCTIWVSREGYPIFKPRLFSMRPSGTGFKDLDKTVGLGGTYDATHNVVNPINSKIDNNWNLSYGGSISGYAPTTDPDSALTQCWVSAATAIDGTNITVITGGTGFQDGSRVIYSGLGGNREGLMFTSGVQQVDQFELSNLILGLDWNTNPSSVGWGARFIDGNGDTAIQVNPPFYTGSISISKTTNGYSDAKTKIQRTINFFLQRQLMAPYQVNGRWILGVTIDGRFNTVTEEGVKQLQRFAGIAVSGIYTQTLTAALQKYLVQNAEFVKFDPMWYVRQPFGWLAYISAITGAPLVVTTKANQTPTQGDDYIPDQIATQKAVAKWAQGFSKAIINIGNRRVDEAIDKSTQRTISTNMADPRIQPGDVIWCNIPGHLEPSNAKGNLKPPFKNGIYVTQVERSMDLQSPGGYTATYSGYRYRGDFAQDLRADSINKGYDFI